MNRRDLLLRGAAAAAGTTLLGSTGGLLRPARASAVTHCLWGAHAEPVGAQNEMTALAAFEKLVGRKMAVDRQYYSWTAELPTSQMIWDVGNGRIPYVSWHAWTGSNAGSAVSWRSIANGSRDTWIKAQALRLKHWGQHFYFCFHHEPENDLRCGSAADFVAAYEHVRKVFDAEGVTNATWVLTLMASTYSGHHGGAAKWAPSASTYGLVGVDGYNRWPYIGHSYRSFDAIFQPTRQFALSRGKNMAIGEFGCVEQVKNGKGDPQGKAKWLTAGGKVLEGWPDVVFACYSHVLADGLKFWVNTSAPSLAAYKAVGNSAYFRG